MSSNSPQKLSVRRAKRDAPIVAVKLLGQALEGKTKWLHHMDSHPHREPFAFRSPAVCPGRLLLRCCCSMIGCATAISALLPLRTLDIGKVADVIDEQRASTPAYLQTPSFILSPGASPSSPRERPRRPYVRDTNSTASIDRSSSSALYPRPPIPIDTTHTSITHHTRSRSRLDATLGA